MAECRVVRVEVARSFTDDPDFVSYIAVCSTGAEFTGSTTGAALLAHHEAHGPEDGTDQEAGR